MWFGMFIYFCGWVVMLGGNAALQENCSGTTPSQPILLTTKAGSTGSIFSWKSCNHFYQYVPHRVSDRPLRAVGITILHATCLDLTASDARGCLSQRRHLTKPMPPWQSDLASSPHMQVAVVDNLLCNRDMVYPPRRPYAPLHGHHSPIDHRTARGQLHISNVAGQHHLVYVKMHYE